MPSTQGRARRGRWSGGMGGSGVAVDMPVLYLLPDPAMLNWDLTLSKVAAAEVAIVNNFLWNDVWTFRGARGKELAGTFAAVRAI